MARSTAAHILIVLHDFAAGGSERIMIRLGNAWAARGRRVTILCGGADGPARALVGPGVRVIGVEPAIRRGRRSRRRLGRAIAARLPELDADILVGPGNYHLPVLAAIGEAPLPLVCKLSNALERPGRGPLRRWLFGRRLRRESAHLAALVAISAALAEEAKRFVPGIAVHALPQPNIADDQPPPASRAPRTPPHILVAGRLAPQKRVALALRTLVLLPGATLTLAGDGPERRRLEALAHRLGIAGRVHLAGHVPDIAPLLADADLLLSTSAYEGYPAVLVEALAAGVPVVTTPSSPAIPEILDHPSFGRIAAAGPEALAEAILKVAAGDGPDPAALAAFLDRHRVSRAAAAWLALLDGIAAAG